MVPLAHSDTYALRLGHYPTKILLPENESGDAVTSSCEGIAPKDKMRCCDVTGLQRGVHIISWGVRIISWGCEGNVAGV